MPFNGWVTHRISLELGPASSSAWRLSYVDDTDLLLRSKSRDLTMDQFFHDCQTAVTDWGKIVLATGGYLEAGKCFWYMMGWKWVNGVPQLRTLQQLPKYSLTIPQKIGSPTAIPLRDVGDAEETLGVYGPVLKVISVYTSKRRWR